MIGAAVWLMVRLYGTAAAAVDWTLDRAFPGRKRRKT